MNYGKAIRICRTAHGLTQSQLAERLSVGKSHLSLIESDKRAPSLKVLDEVSIVLGVPPHLLTLLASEPGDLRSPNNERETLELAKALLNLLVSAGDQQSLPLKNNKPI